MLDHASNSLAMLQDSLSTSHQCHKASRCTSTPLPMDFPTSLTQHQQHQQRTRVISLVPPLTTPPGPRPSK